MVKAGADALIASEQILTEYDSVAGDGDCGMTMKRGAPFGRECEELRPARAPWGGGVAFQGAWREGSRDDYIGGGHRMRAGTGAGLG
jgi:hypothetical protein